MRTRRIAGRQEATSLSPRAELLWRLYAENREYARLHENQRSAAANLVVASSAALIGLATFDQKLSTADLPATSFLIVVGLFGSVFSSKHYERTRLHLNRAKQYLRQLDATCPRESILALQEAANDVNKAAFPMLHKVKLNTLWNVFYLLIAMIGAVLSAYTLHLANSVAVPTSISLANGKRLGEACVQPPSADTGSSPSRR